MRVGSDNVGLASPVVFHYIFGTFVSGPRYQAFCDQHTQQTASMIEWKQIEISVPCPRFSWTGRFSVAAILVLTTLVAGLVYSLSPPPKRGTATLTLPTLSSPRNVIHDNEYFDLHIARLRSPSIFNSALRRLPFDAYPQEIHEDKHNGIWSDEHLTTSVNADNQIVVTLSSSTATQLQLQNLADAICDVYTFKVMILDSLRKATNLPAEEAQWIGEAKRFAETIRFASIRREAHSSIALHVELNSK